MKKPDLILTSDWHLRETKPVARTDDFENEQWRKLVWIGDLSEEWKCPVICGGDLFHHWKPSPELLTKTIMHLPRRFATIYGNHDLPEHSLAQALQSGVHTLFVGQHLDIPNNGVHWGLTPSNYSYMMSGRSVLVWHVLTYQGKDLPFPGCKALSAKQILKKYPEYDLILTGDNHKTFVEEYEGRLLVNPGSIFRMTAAQIDHKPCVFLWYAQTNTVKQVFIPIAKDVISREHIDEKEIIEKRIDAFISSLDNDFEAAMDFETNLQMFFDQNNVRGKIKQIILNSLA